MTPRKSAAAKVKPEAAPATVTATDTPPAAQITIKHKMPELPAYWYDGTNAFQVAQWLAAQGTQAQITFPTAPNSLPQLVDPVSHAPLATQVYVLPSMETIDQVDLAANYDIVSTP